MLYSLVLIKQLEGIQRRDYMCMKMSTFDCLKYSIENKVGVLMSKM